MLVETCVTEQLKSSDICRSYGEEFLQTNCSREGVIPYIELAIFLFLPSLGSM